MTLNPNLTLKEAKHLYDLGLAILWIKPKSKAPVRSRWTTGPRENWDQLKASFKPSYNVGVRLGTPSKIGDKFLAVIDIDIKSTDPKHRVEAELAVTELFPAFLEAKKMVQVMSGRGNGSSHIYILTKKPTPPQKILTSPEKVKVMMPSAPINPSQKEVLTDEDLNEGWRMRPAWEIAIMGEGQQVVLPPSLHPDSGRAYVWKTRLDQVSDLHEIELTGKKKEDLRSTTNDWKPVEVDLAFSDLDESIVELILNADCEDRSAALFKVTLAMVKYGFTDHQIMSVLTDPNYELSKTSYDHAKTQSRARAANWVFNYTIKRARREGDARLQFNEEVETTILTDEDAAKQLVELHAPDDWKTRIERYGPKGVNANAPKPTIKNLILILENEVALDVVKRDTFALRDFYGHPTPWGGKKDALINDDDAVKIKVWCSNRYRFEPKKDMIFDALTYVAEKNSFDPALDWLESLPEWDGINRLDTWLSKNFEAEGDPEYLAQVFRKWMVAMVMRVYRPGTKFDWMPIFEGKQGIGKSSIGRLLVGEKYFVDWLPDLANKDSALALQGAWAVEMGELANLRKNDMESAKAFITRTLDKVRPPYGRKQIEIPRRCVFFGTTNSDTYLRDDSGNRRFKPVKVGQLNFDAIEKDRDQLFCEAVFIYKNGFETAKTLDMEGQAKIYELEIQSEKMVMDEADHMREDLVDFIDHEYSKKEDENKFDFTKFRIKDLMGDFGPFPQKRGDTRTVNFIAKALKKLGAKKWRSNGTVYWKIPEIRVPQLKGSTMKVSPGKSLMDH